MFREEGPAAFYKGITPRVARVAPGQAVVFTVYERIKRFVSPLPPFDMNPAEKNRMCGAKTQMETDRKA